jgi:WD40 repeat protein
MRALAAEVEECLQEPPRPARRVFRRRWPAAALVVAAVTVLGVGFYLAVADKSPPITRPESRLAAGLRQSIAPARTFAAHSSAVNGVAFRADGQGLSCGKDRVGGSVRVWDLENGVEVAGSRREFRILDGVALAPDGHRFAVAALQSLEMHDLSPSRKTRMVDSQGPHTGPMAFSGNGHRIIVGKKAVFGELFALVWDLEAGKTFRFDGHTDRQEIRCAALSYDGRYALSAAADAVRWWEVDTGREVGHLDRSTATSLLFLGNDKALIGGELGSLVLWERGSDKHGQRFEGHTDTVTCLALAPEAGRVLSGSADKSIRLWDVGTGKELARLEGHTAAVSAVAFAADGRRVISGGADGSVCVWRLSEQ